MFSCIFLYSWPKSQEICNRIISEDPFSIRYVADQCKTQQWCDETANDCLAAL